MPRDSHHRHVAKYKWWGYLRTNGSVQAKPYFDHQDLEDAYASPFCARVFEPFEFETTEDTRDYAIAHIKSILLSEANQGKEVKL